MQFHNVKNGIITIDFYSKILFINILENINKFGFVIDENNTVKSFKVFSFFMLLYDPTNKEKYYKYTPDIRYNLWKNDVIHFFCDMDIHKFIRNNNEETIAYKTNYIYNNHIFSCRQFLK